MEFPALMPQELAFYLAVPSEELLFAALIKKTSDLVLFLETVAEDQVWATDHVELIKKLLDWLTIQSFHDRLSKSHYQRAADVIKKHYALFESSLPTNIDIKLKDADLTCNGLLLTAASDFLKQMLLTKSRSADSSTLSFPTLTASAFTPLQTFICKGDIVDLPTKGEKELMDLIQRANAWDLSSLSLMCESMLSKYITAENVFDRLASAKGERWAHFEHSCLTFINERDWGFRLSLSSYDGLAFEFLNFYERTLAFFDRLRPIISEIICCGSLAEQPQFGRVLRACPTLFALDISQTAAFYGPFQEIPTGLKGLNLSECPWISQETLRDIFTLCPHLKKLSLKYNVHLTYVFWAELAKFKKLTSLDLSYCSQMQDGDLSLLLKGLNFLTELSLQSCKKVGEKGFLEIAVDLPRLTRLNLSRCTVSDTALIELAIKCHYLTVLNISACTELTEKGILAFLKQAPSLRELNLLHCRISRLAIEQIKKIYPQIVLI